MSTGRPEMPKPSTEVIVHIVSDLTGHDQFSIVAVSRIQLVKQSNALAVRLLLRRVAERLGLSISA